MHARTSRTLATLALTLTIAACAPTQPAATARVVTATPTTLTHVHTSATAPAWQTTARRWRPRTWRQYHAPGALVGIRMDTRSHGTVRVTRACAARDRRGTTLVVCPNGRTGTS